MSLEIVPISRQNLDVMSRVGAKFGMPRSAKWLERCMFDPTVEDLVNDNVRGHMAIVDNDNGVAVQGYYYIPVYFHQTKFLCNSGCIMGAEADYAANLIICIEENHKTEKVGICVSDNCIANNKSAKVCKILNGLKEAPRLTREFRFAVSDITGYIVFSLRCFRLWSFRLPRFCINVVWCALRPFAWMSSKIQALFRPRFGFEIEKLSSFDSDMYTEFWNRFLSANNGLVTSRSPERMRWLFDKSIEAGFVSLLVAKRNGRMEGYVMVRKMPRRPGWTFFDCQIIDICALDNDMDCLRSLVNAAVSCAGDMGGLRIFMYGALPRQNEWLNQTFKHKRMENHPTFMYKVNDSEIAKSLENGKGWFFGPMDGERCLGNGGHIDL